MHHNTHNSSNGHFKLSNHQHAHDPVISSLGDGSCNVGGGGGECGNGGGGGCGNGGGGGCGDGGGGGGGG